MPAQPANEFLFYQAADGQWMFMSPLDMRILASVHGSLQSCPALLRAPILSMEAIPQTETTRRRFKSLAHLPLTGLLHPCPILLRQGLVCLPQVLPQALESMCLPCNPPAIVVTLCMLQWPSGRGLLSMRACR